MKNISVCSWSYRLSAARVAEEMTKSGVTHVHLALNPFVDPLAVVPGTAGETENVAGTGGVDSLEKQRADIEEYLASGRWVISSTLHNSRYDDYSTLESIRRTGGLVPDEHWEENKAIIAKVVKLTAEWKAPYMMLHAGYINHADPVGFAKLTDRLKYVRDLCADAGIGLTLETGQETANPLMLTVDAVKTVTPYFNGKWVLNEQGTSMSDGYWTLPVSGTREALTAGTPVAKGLVPLIDLAKGIEGGGAFTGIVGQFLGCYNASATKRGILAYVNEVRLPETVEKINDSAFQDCTSASFSSSSALCCHF